uniref:Transmembrane protein n=1 Tax=Pithovirus LCPAC202 TaxID=2506592 RepID=A0A481Z6N5_9VIRU|nr:MAG: hypothetical protein LCPAC202_01890 [Pithovirus LCPAC202]
MSVLVSGTPQGDFIIPASTVTTVQDTKKSSFWGTSHCNQGRELFIFSVVIFIIIIIIGLVINCWALFKSPRTDNSGKEITTSQLWIAGIIGISFYLIVSFIIGWWLYEKYRECNSSSYWWVFVISILIAIILAPITGVIMGAILGIGFIWTVNQEPNLI